MVCIGHGDRKELDMTEKLSLHFTTDDYQGYKTHKSTFHPISQLTPLPTLLGILEDQEGRKEKHSSDNTRTIQ